MVPAGVTTSPDSWGWLKVKQETTATATVRFIPRYTVRCQRMELEDGKSSWKLKEAILERRSHRGVRPLNLQ